MKPLVFTVFIVVSFFGATAQNVGIGTTIPNYPLTVAADANFKGIAQKSGTVEIGFYTNPQGAAYLQTWSPHDLNFATNNGSTRLMIANTTGYVGVGTSLPTAQLDINGSFRLRGNGAAAGNILVSDASGNAAWQPFGSTGGWSLTGNGGTNPAINFLGTTDNQPLVFRQNNVYAGKFHYGLRNYFIGNQSGINTTAPFNIAMGDSALNDNVSGYSNVALGSGALQQSPGYSNLVAVGDSALFKNGSYNDFSSSANATRNTAVGSKALYSNTIGFGNTAMGFEAGYSNGGGYNNTLIGRQAMRNGGGSGAEGNVAVGAYALDSNQNIHNTAVGAFAMRRNKTGVRNTAMGNSCLSVNSSGSYNVAIGASTLGSNVSGNTNTAIGYTAMSYNQTGYSNVAVGTAALAQSNDYSNLVAIGDSALFLNGSYNDFSSALNATRNTAVGSKALYTNSSGYGNTALGFEAGYANGLAWNNTLIGREAMRHGGGSGAEGNVAVGVYALDSNQNFHNTSIGAYSMRRNRSGINNTAVGYGALGDNLSGSSNTAIGYGAGVSNTTAVSNSTAVGAGAYVTQSNSIVLGTGSTNTGIGTTAPGHALDIQTNSVFGGKAQLRLHETGDDYARLKFTNTSTAYWDVAGYPSNTTTNAQFNFYFSGLGDVLSLKGNGNATLAGTLTQLSDVRLKRNIVPLSFSLKKLLQLNGYRYRWKDEAKDQSLQIGVLAQEVEGLFPELVKKDDNGRLSVNYSGLVPVLITAVKEQQSIIDRLEKRLAALEKKIK